MTTTPAPQTIETIASEPGGFGYELGTLGFSGYFENEGDWGGRWIATESADHLVRVVTYPDDGDRVEVIAFDRKHPAAKLVAWRVSFDGSTPQSVALAAIAAAIA